jgi:hypothetical protein
MGRARCAQDPASKRAGREHSWRIGCVAPPSDEAASTGRPADPGPPKGGRRSAAPAMARLRLPRRTLPDRAKCAHSDPHQLPQHVAEDTESFDRGTRGGGSKSASDRVADRIGLHSQSFFPGNIFPEPEFFKRRCVAAQCRSRILSRAWRIAPRCAGGRGAFSRRIFFRQRSMPPGGDQRILELHAYDRVAGARVFPRNSENFFYPDGAGKIAAKFRVGMGRSDIR